VPPGEVATVAWAAHRRHSSGPGVRPKQVAWRSITCARSQSCDGVMNRWQSLAVKGRPPWIFALTHGRDGLPPHGRYDALPRAHPYFMIAYHLTALRIWPSMSWNFSPEFQLRPSPPRRVACLIHCLSPTHGALIEFAIYSSTIGACWVSG
jgi:hypothetical protein